LNRNVPELAETKLYSLHGRAVWDNTKALPNSLDSILWHSPVRHREVLRRLKNEALELRSRRDELMADLKFKLSDKSRDRLRLDWNEVKSSLAWYETVLPANFESIY
jgi:hypothetical protein